MSVATPTQANIHVGISPIASPTCSFAIPKTLPPHTDKLNGNPQTPTSHIDGTSLRFFNVVGTAAPELLDNSVENLVPIVINKLKANQSPMIYGTDYPTPDGTCIRDYVDVRDIAGAHLAAADSTSALPLAMNVGTGRGGSVREVIKLVCEAAGRNDVTAVEADRRAGDPALLFTDVSLIRISV